MNWLRRLVGRGETQELVAVAERVRLENVAAAVELKAALRAEDKRQREEYAAARRRGFR